MLVHNEIYFTHKGITLIFNILFLIKLSVLYFDLGY
jgi:hypothetical protein